MYSWYWPIIYIFYFFELIFIFFLHCTKQVTFYQNFLICHEKLAAKILNNLSKIAGPRGRGLESQSLELKCHRSIVTKPN